MYQKSCYNSRFISDIRYTYSYFYRVLKYFIYHNNRETDHCTRWHVPVGTKNRSSDALQSPKCSKRKRSFLGIRNSALINGFSILPRVWFTLDMDMGYRFI